MSTRLTKEQEVLLKDLRASHASLAEAEKIIGSMEGLTVGEKRLALRLHIPFANTEQTIKTSVPEPPPVVEANEVLTLGRDNVSRKKSRPKKLSVFWLGFLGFAIGLVVLLVYLFCVTGFGYSIQGTWVGGVGGVEFRSDGSIVALGQKAEGLTWHGDYICLKADMLPRQNLWVDFAPNAVKVTGFLVFCRVLGAKGSEFQILGSVSSITLHLPWPSVM